MKKPKILIDADIPFIRGRLEQVADVKYQPGDKFNPNDLKEADALIVRTRTRCNEALLDGTNIKLIVTATIGKDHIDEEWCANHDVEVKSCPGCNAPGVAQYVLSSLLHSGFTPPKTLGVVGYGHVGSIVAKWATDMGYKVLICDPPRKESGETDVEYLELEEVLRESDAITLHVPLTREGNHATFNLIGEKELDKMKKDSFIINTSRGGVVNEKALKEKLAKGKMKAIIDVWEQEPVIDSELLSKVEIGTPHIAGYSYEGKMRATGMALDAVCDYFNIKADREGLPSLPNGKDLKITENILLQSYKPDKDSKALKENSESFETLRNNYDYRHEPGYLKPEKEVK